MTRKIKYPAVFLDRDGTLIDERGYLSDPGKIHFYRSAFSALRLLQKNGFRLIVVTNQSGVGRGYFSLAQLKRVNAAFDRRCKVKNIHLSGIYFCPHRPEAGCACRKPKIKLVRQAARTFHLDLKKSYMIGDQPHDVLMAQRFGGTGILVLTGAGRASRKNLVSSRAIVKKNIFSAAQWIVANACTTSAHH